MDEQLKQYLLDKAQQEYDARQVSQGAGLMSGFGQVLQGRPVDTEWIDKRNKLAYDETLGRLKLEQSEAEKRAEQKRQFDVEQAYKNKALEETIKSREQVAKIAAGERNDRRKMDDALKAAEAIEKKAEKAAQYGVPGLEKSEDITPTLQEVSQLRSTVNTVKELSPKLERLKDLVVGNKEKGIEAHGPFQMFGDDAAEMQTLAREIQLLAKNKDMYELGVLAGPDLKLLEDITADPSSVSSFFTSTSSRKKQIETQLESLKNKLTHKAESLGYKSKQEGTSQFPRQVRKGNQIATVQNEQELKEAQSEGWQ